MQVVVKWRGVARPESEAPDETFTEGTLRTQMFSKAGEIVELRLMHDKAGGPKVGCSELNPTHAIKSSSSRCVARLLLFCF
jgi:hypothetical protein